MTPAITLLIDASYALAVAGVAMLWTPGALIVAAVYLLAQAVLMDRRSPETPA